MKLYRFLTRYFEYTSGIARRLIADGDITVDRVVITDDEYLVALGQTISDGVGTVSITREHLEADGWWLTQEQANRLPVGATVEVIWANGNGLRQYTITGHNPLGEPIIDNPYCNRLSFVGEAPHHTRVRIIARGTQEQTA